MSLAGAGPIIRRPIGEAEVAQILAIRDPVLRNLWITLAYHDLAVAMTRIAGVRNVSWVAFATWASKTAGVSIRKEQLSDLLRDHLAESDEWAHVTGELRLLEHALDDLDAVVARVFDRSIDRMSAVIAEGNRTVFEELGPIFARIAALDDGARTPGALEAFLASVRAIDRVDGDATERLRQAFRIYHLVWQGGDGAPPRTATQQVLLANGLIGLTEQIRLQPAIRGALDAVIEVGLGDAVAPLLRRFVPRRLLDLLEHELERVWRRAVTRHLLTLRTPDGLLDLSEDVPLLAPPDRRFPDDLAAAVDPGLVGFLLQHDRTNGLGQPSGARDWASLKDRMNYIVNLFRSRQQRSPLLLPPFDEDQIKAMQEGRVPAPPI